MNNAKQMATLTTLLTKNNFEVKVIEKNKSLIAMRKNYPRLLFQIIKSYIVVRNIKELNNNAIKETNVVLTAINDLNKSTLLSKYYLQPDNKLYVEAVIIDFGNEKEFSIMLIIIKNDMKQLLEKYRPLKKYLEK
ncbi:MAG: hypothetical protein FD143_1841 [Ignavibacteria bacterium]|nr:MAG: hypothetical protein FD143_1841 [Ignavibacteria bacterium]KAF0157713.1 MAG: hypothetical protein FD188_2692 [Ignavibacteria bacterium]